MEWVDGSASCGFEGGADGGVEPRAFFGSEAADDFAECQAGAQGPFRAVVGGLEAGLFEEDEEVLAVAFDEPGQLLAMLASRRGVEDAVERRVEARDMGFERGRAQVLAPSPDPAGPLDQAPELPGIDRLAAVDGVLQIAVEIKRGRPDGRAWPSPLAAQALAQRVWAP